MSSIDDLDRAIESGRVTNMHLAVAMKNTMTDVKDIKKELVPLKKENAENTLFRQKAYGVVIGVGAVWTFIVGAGLWFIDKIWGKN